MPPTKIPNTVLLVTSISSAIFIIVFALLNCTSNTKSIQSTPSDSLTNHVIITVKGDKRIIESNSVPNHPIGKFPNPHNPNSMKAQKILLTMTTNPQVASYVEIGSAISHGSGYTTEKIRNIGVAINGVLLEPGTAEVWNPATQKRTNSQRGPQRGPQKGIGFPVAWNYDGLGPNRSGDFVGMDQYKGHVQPTGKYHYHFISTKTGLYSDTNNNENTAHSSLVAFAADGFPIFGLYGYDEEGNNIIKMFGNYRLKNDGSPREAIQEQNPGGNYDGTFTQDYEFALGIGDVDHIAEGIQTSILDIANGHVGKVPASEMEKYEYDSRYLGEKNDDDTYTIYHYHITENYPYMPRILLGEIAESFQDTRRGTQRGAQQGDAPPKRKRDGDRGKPPKRDTRR